MPICKLFAFQKMERLFALFTSTFEGQCGRLVEAH